MENWLKKGFDDEDLSCSLMIKEFALAISGPRKVKEKAVEIAGLVDDFDNVGRRRPSTIIPILIAFSDLHPQANKQYLDTT